MSAQLCQRPSYRPQLERVEDRLLPGDALWALFAAPLTLFAESEAQPFEVAEPTAVPQTSAPRVVNATGPLAPIRRTDPTPTASAARLSAPPPLGSDWLSSSLSALDGSSDGQGRGPILHAYAFSHFEDCLGYQVREEFGERLASAILNVERECRSYGRSWSLSAGPYYLANEILHGVFAQDRPQGVNGMTFSEWSDEVHLEGVPDGARAVVYFYVFETTYLRGIAGDQSTAHVSFLGTAGIGGIGGGRGYVTYSLSGGVEVGGDWWFFDSGFGLVRAELPVEPGSFDFPLRTYLEILGAVSDINMDAFAPFAFSTAVGGVYAMMMIDSQGNEVPPADLGVSVTLGSGFDPPPPW